ncbi:MAG: cell wall metabolism sensor histidine kinase WalK [Oscillospiraceae bacterium]|nr:cell wall metabolism sensor histidine kinase WalK [Oscillospiraceae bacterium]
MRDSLRGKLVFIMLLLIIMLMATVFVFLIRGVQTFYSNEFYERMETAFGDADMLTALRSAADDDDAARQMGDILKAYAGKLGIDSDQRNYYILDGGTGEMLLSSAPEGQGASTVPKITPNVLAALASLAGERAYGGNTSEDYMDIAVPIAGEGGARFVVYILDSRQTVRRLSSEIFTLIMEAVAVGFVISSAVSLVLSRTLLQPIRGMTRAAEAMAGGDFSRKIPVESADEIGVLSGTFNNMASQLETTLEELRRAEKLRRDFVANVSHELRTPLTSIRTFAETLSDDSDMPPQTRARFLGVILNESNRMTKIVEDLLELSKFDAGITKLSSEEFSLDRSMREVSDAVVLAAAERGHIITLAQGEPLPKIVGDRARVEQVLMNIMTNAIKYTPEGGEIVIYGGFDEKYAWVTIRDNGIGIPSEDLEHVFDRFYRVDKARSRESGGTGLGLSIAYDIIRLHGGDITMESEPGQGTTVTVKLPIHGIAGALPVAADFGGAEPIGGESPIEEADDDSAGEPQ